MPTVELTRGGTTAAAITTIAAGGIALALDERHEWRRGALIAAADLISVGPARAMREIGGGLCLALTATRCDALGVRVLGGPCDSLRMAFTETIDARDQLAGGSPLSEQVAVMRRAADPGVPRAEFVIGGHVRPVQAHDDGVLGRPALAEAGIDLARLAGRAPAAVLCCVDDDEAFDQGHAGLEGLAQRLGVPIVHLAELVRYRLRRHRTVERVVSVSLPTRFGDFDAIGYRSSPGEAEYVALVRGDPRIQRRPLAHVHVECLAGDVFHGCECGDVLTDAMKRIAREDAGVVVYVSRQARREAPVPNCVDSVASDGEYALSREGAEVANAAHVLRELGIRSIRLAVPHPQRAQCLRDMGLEVEDAH